MAIEKINLLTNIYKNYKADRAITPRDLSTKILPDLENIISRLNNTDADATVTSDRVIAIEGDYVTSAELALKSDKCFTMAMSVALG